MLSFRGAMLGLACAVVGAAAAVGCTQAPASRTARPLECAPAELGLLTPWDVQLGSIEADWNEPFLYLFFDADVYSVPALLEVLSNKNLPSRQRAQAAMILGRYRCAEALAPLLSSLDDPDLQVACGAVRGLGDLRDKRAVPALLSKLAGALSDPAIGMVPTGVECSYERSCGLTFPIGCWVAARPSYTSLDYPDACSEQPMLYQDHIASALGKIGDAAAVPALTDMLSRQEDPERRAFVADALGMIGAPAALPALREAAERNSSSGAVMKGAGADPEWLDWPAQALVQIQSRSKSLEQLEAHLKSADRYARYYAVKCLAERGDETCIPSLQAVLQDETRLRRAAALPTVVETVGKAAADAIERIRARRLRAGEPTGTTDAE